MNKTISLLFTILMTMLFTTSSVLAEKGKDVEKRIKDQTQYKFEFADAKLVHFKKPTNRNQMIRKLEKIVNRIMRKTTGNSDYKAFSAEEVINNREELQDDLQSAGKKIVRTTIDGLEHSESGVKTTLFRDNDFHLTVFANGDAFRFINYRNNYTKRNNAPAKYDFDASKDIVLDTIADLELLNLEDDEEFEIRETNYTHFTGNANDPGDRVVSTTISVGRKINNIPVVGDGSIVDIEYVKGQGIRSILYDWTPISQQEQSELQNVVDEEKFKKRFEGALKSRLKTQGKKEISVAEITAECGYMDRSARNVKSEFMQLGCVVSYTKKGKERDSLKVDTIPLGEQILLDPYWESTILVDEWEKTADETALSISYL